MNKKVLVLGSTGAMGQYIVPYLADMGYSITAVSLDDEKPYNEKVTCIKGNAKDLEFLNSLLSQKFDGIVDFMIYGNHDFRDYYKLFLENTEHYIFLPAVFMPTKKFRLRKLLQDFLMYQKTGIF